MKILYILSILQIFLLILSIFQNHRYKTSEDILISDIKLHLRYFSDDAREGRLPDTRGSYESRKWIIDFYRSLNYYPLFGNQFEQEFEFPAGFVKTNKNQIQILDCLQNCEFEVEPLSLGIAGEKESYLISGNYCLEEDLKELTRTISLNPENYIVVCKRFGGDNKEHRKISFESKYKNIENFKFSGVVFLRENGDSISIQNYFPYRGSIPAGFLSKNENLIMQYIQEQKKVKFFISYEREKRKGRNVGVSLKPWAPHQKTIYLGAHFDHLGRGIPQFSLGPIGEVYNGADDNASGTVSLMELAEYLKYLEKKYNNFFKDFNIVFLHFDAEEWGLMGADYFTKSNYFKESIPVAMINLDMIGRFHQALYIQGKDTGDETWMNIIDNATKKSYMYQFVKWMKGGMGPSDHSVFYRNKLPVLFLFTGTHQDYHKPGDDFIKINYEGIKEISLIVKDVVLNIINSEKLPEYRYTPEKMTMTFRSKVRLGIIPANYYLNDGIEIGGFIQDAPISRTGVQIGDVIIQIDNYKINTIEDLMNFLNQADAGKKYKIIYKRNKEIKETYTELLVTE